MKSEKLQDAVGMIGDDLVEDAKTIQKTKKHRVIKWMTSVAAILAVIITSNFLLDTPVTSLKAYAIAEAQYPKMARYSNEDKASWEAWDKERREREKQFEGYNEGLDGFFTKSMAEFLSDSKDENRVYSPLNVYMALSMLAEITDTNSRQQVLDLLGADSIESLRKQANAVWNANYWDDGVVTSTLANSLWLNQNIDYKEDALHTLADRHYASSYQGTMGSEDYNNLFQSWLNEQTGGLLENQIKELKLEPSTVLALASTIYFRANWKDKFSKGETEQDVFHTANGDITCDFMKQSCPRGYYWGERFTAVRQGLQDSGEMLFILPDEDVTIDELLADTQTMEFILSDEYGWENRQYTMVNFSVPKFDVESQMDLAHKLQNLGITDVFDKSVSDFSPLMENSEGVSVSEVTHGARVMIDEEGCVATAFTVIPGTGGGWDPTDEEVDFTLDRPFIFAITSQDGLPLFVGVVNQPVK